MPLQVHALVFSLAPAGGAQITDVLGARLGWFACVLLILLLYAAFRAYSAHKSMLRDRDQQARETEALHLRTIEGLAMAIEAKDQSTHRHLLRVRVYVSELGRMMNLEPPLMQALLTAAFLHDIGKLAVPEHIINKPGKLNHEEFNKMKIHPVVGADILERVRFPYPVVPIVRSHHESWDGSGYPDGLAGKDIPIGARLLSVVDCFDALASERPYRRVLPLDEAMAHVRSLAGTQFDPEIVALLETCYLSLEEKARRHIDGIKPLRTRLNIDRGNAPGAGLESGESVQAEEPNRNTPTANHSFGTLNLIAAAGQEATAVLEINQLLGSSLSTRETSEMLCQRLRELVPFECFAVYLKSAGWLTTQFLDGDCARAFSARRIAVGEGLSGWVAQSGKAIINGNPSMEFHYLQDTGILPSTASALSIPLIDSEGEITGVLTLYSTLPAAFTRDHLRILQAVEPKFSLSLQNALRFKLAEADAKLDFLTQLPNMRFFLEEFSAEIERVQNAGQRFAIAICDLNEFKVVNDELGHLAGNQLLKGIAHAFRRRIRAEDIVARLGGDEFAFLFRCMDASGEPRQRENIAEAVRLASKDLNLAGTVSASVGMSFYPADGTSTDALLKLADSRMYAVKQMSRRPPSPVESVHPIPRTQVQ